MVKDNRLFRRVLDRGYRIHVVQTSYLDSCSGQYDIIASCRTYPANSITSLQLLPITAHRRMFLEYAFFFERVGCGKVPLAPGPSARAPESDGGVGRCYDP